MMNALDQLTTPRKASSPSGKAGRRSLPAAVLPLGLAAGFIAVFAFLFGSRLLPAVPVRIAPVVALRGAGAEAAPADQSPRPEAGSTASIPANQPLLFQASGWVEPDPFPIFVPALVDGVVREVHVLEGQLVSEGDLLATLIDDDAQLDLKEARRKIKSLVASREAHCAALPVIKAKRNAAEKRIDAEKARLAELRDVARRLATAGQGAVSDRDVTQARLKVQRQEAALEEAQSELPRLLAETEQIHLERAAIDARIREAETELDRKQLAFDRTRITAPAAGRILRLHAAPGKKRIRAMDDPKSAVIVELYDPDRLQARIDVPLSEAASLEAGQPVRITTDLLPDANLPGTVTRIVGEADLQRNTLQAKVRIHGPDPRLRPEMLVRAEFFPMPDHAASRRPAGSSPPAGAAGGGSRLSLFAPVKALVRPSSGTARVWVKEGDRATLRSLSLGDEVRDGHRLVLDGLRPGDQLILPPHDELEPGQRIEVLPPGR